MKGGYLKLIVYASLIFLFITLIRADYLFLPEIRSPAFLILSLLCLFTAFVAESVPWRKMLSDTGYPISIKSSLISVGLPIFGKYIPGKFWSIIGRSGYIASRYRYPGAEMAAVSLNAQLLALLCGLMLGSTGLLFFTDQLPLVWSSLLLCVLLGSLVFFDTVHRLGSYLLVKLGKKDILLPHLHFRSIKNALPGFFLQWILWCVGFQFLVLSLTDTPVPPYLGLAFSLAGTLGILSIITPGGLGVREGILGLFLVSAGLSGPEAASVSVASRLWFLTGECSIFILAFVYSRKEPNT